MNHSKVDVDATVLPLFSTHLRKLHRTLHASLPCKYEDVACDVSLEELAKSAINKCQGERGLTAPTFMTSNVLVRKNCRTERLYKLRLLRRILLARFELLCTSLELLEDVGYAFDACKAICVAAEQFNTDALKAFGSGEACLTVADFADVLVETHSRRISDQLCSTLRADVALREARFELGFVRAFLGILATHTSLLPGAPKSTSYVSEEMFTILTGPTSTPTWYDCLVPGAQCEALRTAAHDLSVALWRRVGVALVTKLQHRGEARDLAGKLRTITATEGLSYHVPAVKSLWYTAVMLEQAAALVDWDIGMQQMLAASSTGYGIYKSSNGITQPSRIFITHVIPPLVAYFSTFSAPSDPPSLASPPGLARHLDALGLCRSVGVALRVSAQQVYLFLSVGLRQAEAALNLRTLAQLLYVDGPAVSRELGVAVKQGGAACAPRVFLPEQCLLKGTERQSRDVCTQLCRRKAELEELLEGVSASFYHQWRTKCTQVIVHNFPDRKRWRAIGKENHVMNLVPSPCIEAIISGLIFPCMDAASHLPRQPQLSFLSLTISAVIAELRKIITSNKRLYRPFAGRQLLTDCRHISKCLQSKEVGLDPDVSNSLPLLPALQEMEHGLLVVCGTASGEEARISPAAEVVWDQPSSDLSREQAWYSQSDWTECID